jgi:ubiquinone/menaquinone biosynthesis C-methylase UbiE
MGRTIAPTMGFAHAAWLLREERQQEENCDLMLNQLGLRPRMTVCDLGCGNGFYTLRLTQVLADSGQVFAVDDQPEMLSLLRDRLDEAGVVNVVPILGSYHNPRLPQNSIDLALLVDVYHEFSHPPQMLSAIRQSLKPRGRIVLVEFRMEDDSVPIKPVHKMSKAQINKELSANGFQLESEFDSLPWQHMMFFSMHNGPSAERSDDTSQANGER